ncbi:aliphatic amidase [Candidatus Gastranaerophilus sp. (ex Termes propinquus)]|nr:aliphatic amidase [Candidatus Gastranaerophilus sp. (ex Termes propinquus)]
MCTKSHEKSILALQLPCDRGARHVNFARVEKILESKEVLPDILVLPEVWTVGWAPLSFAQFAENEQGETLNFLKNLARAYSINIVGGSYIRREGNQMFNSCPIINRQGELLAHYDKNHLFANDGEKDVLTPGKKLLSLDIEGIQVGFSICYDIRFPELFRSLLNTEPLPHFFINTAAWPISRKEHYTILCRARAVENQAYFLGLSQCGESRSGASILVDPFGETVLQLADGQGEIFAHIDTQKVDSLRAEYPNIQARREYSLC